MSSPAVSVILPSVGQMPFLRRAVRSVLAQTDADFELIVVVDDSSRATDTTAWVRSLADRRARGMRSDRGPGVANARNAGIKQANGELVAFLDEDDFWAPSKLLRHRELMDSSGATFTYSASIVVDHDLEPTRVLEPPPPAALSSSLRRANAVGSPSGVVVSRAAIEAVGGFDSAFSVFADWDLWLRLAPVVEPAVCPEVLIAYARHGENMHLTAGLPALVREFQLLARKHAGTHPIDSLATARWLGEAYESQGWRVRSTALKAWATLRDPEAGIPLMQRLRGRRLRPYPAPPPAPTWLEQVGRS